MSITAFFFKYVLSAAVTALVVLVSYLKYRLHYWERKKFPFLPPKFPWGNLQHPKNRTESVGVHVNNLYKEAKMRNLKHCGIYFFCSPVYLVADLDYLKNIMSKDFNFFMDRGMYFNEKDDPISAHLFAVGGHKWQNLRTKLTPTFTPGKMKMMFPTLVECVNILLGQLESGGGAMEYKEISARFTTDIIGSCAFGLDCNTIKEDDSPFRIYGKKVFTSSRMRTFKMSLATNFPKIARFFAITQVSRDISDFFTQIVRDTVEYREKNNFQRNDFMQMLIEMKNEGVLTFEEIVAQSFIFFLGGFETSSATMTFTLYEMAKNQRIQERLRQEIGDVLDKHDGEITYDAIVEMKYLDQVVIESLRKYPPLPFVTRTCVQDYPIPGTDLTIEKGRRVVIPILGIQRDPEHYPDPETFDPDRFSEENKRSRHPFAHIAFGEGPRLCIGMRFGQMQVKVGLVALLQKFKFTVNEKTKEPLKMAMHSFTLSADGGIWLDCNKIE